MAYYPEFTTTERQEVFAVVSAHPFAMVVKNNDQTGVPDVVNAPVIFSEDGANLEFHFARSNPAWENFAAGGNVTLVFNGPNAQISPSWYKERFAHGDRSQTAPTWDYVQARITATLQPMNDQALTAHLHRLTLHFEGSAGWQFEELDKAKRTQWQSYIGGFVVRPDTVWAIFKLSQEQKPEDRAHIIEALKVRNNAGDTTVAALIEQSLPMPRMK